MHTSLEKGIHRATPVKEWYRRARFITSRGERQMDGSCCAECRFNMFIDTRAFGGVVECQRGGVVIEPFPCVRLDGV